jgi:NAD-dependent dihydropyrimidine dehydrogenase PreA subunit
MSEQEPKKTGNAWRVEFDTEACSLCEMCVNRCPTGSLFVRSAGEKLEILFDSRLCHSCRGEMYCEFHCPENAVTVSQITEEELPAEPVVLISGQMATCQDCGNPFMPERKLSTLLEQEKITPKSVQNCCPDCRRNHLLDSYLDATGQNK